MSRSSTRDITVTEMSTDTHLQALARKDERTLRQRICVDQNVPEQAVVHAADAAEVLMKGCLLFPAMLRISTMQVI